MLTEFGGIAIKERGSNIWGYSMCRTQEELAERYEALLRAVRKLGLVAGFCYTQFSDTYQEANGLLYADRRPKIAISRIAAATSGPAPSLLCGLEQIHSFADTIDGR